MQSLWLSSGGRIDCSRGCFGLNCLLKEMTTAYGKLKNPIAKNYTNFVRNSKVAYQSATHCNRFVQNLGNSYAKNYGAYENAGRLKPGAMLAKDSFTVSGDGKMVV